MTRKPKGSVELTPVHFNKVELSKGKGLGALVDLEEGRRRLHAIAISAGLLPKTSKRRMRRQRGKLRMAWTQEVDSGDAGEIDFDDLKQEARNRRLHRARPDDGYGPESLAVLAPLIERDNRRRPFTTAELSPEQVEAIERSRMDARHDHLNKLLDD